jgi:hypothetical protein
LHGHLRSVALNIVGVLPCARWSDQTVLQASFKPSTIPKLKIRLTEIRGDRKPQPQMPKPMEIVSGDQSGADRSAPELNIAHGIPQGGGCLRCDQREANGGTVGTCGQPRHPIVL